LKIIKEYSPETVEKLIELVQKKCRRSRKEIVDRVMYLQRLGKITLTEPTSLSPFTLKTFVFSNQAYWYWITLAVSAITVVLVFAVAENLYPIVYIRYVFGLVFILWFPGYTFVKALFPRKGLDSVERISLSIGMSLAIVIIVGFLLNYTPWGITVTSITLSFLAFTTVFATVAMIREYESINA